jgi:hypothetical protein
MDAAQQISDATKDAVQQLVQQSLLQLIESAKTLAEQAVVGTKQFAESAVQPHGVVDQATEKVLSAVEHAAESASAPIEKSLPEEKPAEKRSGGGSFRFVLLGLIVGGLVAYFMQRGGDDDEEFGEENWIEVKHDEAGTGPARADQAAPASDNSGAEPAPAPKQPDLDAHASDN